jgi:hypothetical protein
MLPQGCADQLAPYLLLPGARGAAVEAPSPEPVPQAVVAVWEAQLHQLQLGTAAVVERLSLAEADAAVAVAERAALAAELAEADAQVRWGDIWQDG